MSFSRTLAISVIIHSAVALLISGVIRPTPKVPRVDPSQVVWTQTVPQKAMPKDNKLPPPDVSPKKVSKPEPEKINIEKPKPTPKEKDKPKKDRKKLLEEALAKIQDQVKDDRPTPKADNFNSGPETPEPPKLSSDEVNAIKVSPEMIAYTNTIHSLVVENFLWYQSEKDYQAQIEIRLAPDGSIEASDVIQPSGNVSFDQATLRAIKKSSPFPPPPGRLAALFAQETIVFTFDGSQI